MRAFFYHQADVSGIIRRLTMLSRVAECETGYGSVKTPGLPTGVLLSSFSGRYSLKASIRSAITSAMMALIMLFMISVELGAQGFMPVRNSLRSAR